MAQLQYGMNINGHPSAALGRPANPRELEELAWIRFVFLMHAAVISPNDATNIFGYDLKRPTDYADALKRAFTHYDCLIENYAQHGVRTLMILNQETYSGNGPWHEGSDGNWERYAHDFGVICGKIAEHYKDMSVDYEIWNEGDMPGGPSSVFIPADKFASVLQAASSAIYRNDPDARVIFGGLVNGAVPASQYVNAVRQSLDNVLPVDAVGIHPYGQRLVNQPNIPVPWPGRLDEDTLSVYTQQLNEPLWITEIGISEPGAVKPEHYQAVAEYMRGALNLIENKYSDRVPVVIWFGWSDLMREAGITDYAGRPKEYIYDTFFDIARTGVLAPPPQPRPKYRLRIVSNISGLSVREADGTKFPQLAQVKQGQKLVVLEDPDLAIAKLGKRGQWLNVRTPDNMEGWTAAWLVQPTPESAAILDMTHVSVPLLVTPTASALNIRTGDLTKLPRKRIGDVNATIRPGDEVDVLEDAQIAFEKVRLGSSQNGLRENHWVHIRTPDGVVGWSAAWYLTPAEGSDIPDPLPNRQLVPIKVDPDDSGDGGTSDPEDPLTIQAAVVMIQQAYGVKVELLSVAEYAEMQQLLAALQSYGVVLRNSHEQAGIWNLNETRSVHHIVEKTAEQTGQLFEAMYGVNDKDMAFKALYAPMLIARDGRQYVGPNGERWYAKNANGFELIFGNAAFFAGEQQSRALAGTTRKFTSEQLIAHEIAHAINWRYMVRPLDNASEMEVNIYYLQQVEQANGLGVHDGFVFGAQSSTKEYETVTDAIASLNLDLFTADHAGKIRKAQLVNLMKLVIRYRVEEFDASDLDLMLSQADRSYPGLLSRITPGTVLADVPRVENWLDNLVPLDEGTGEGNGDESDDARRAILRIDSDYINVRSGPGLEFSPPIGSIEDGSTIDWFPDSQTRDAADRFTWVQVKNGSLTGWIARREGKVRFEESEEEGGAEFLTNTVIDVSHWQVISDWQAVYDDGIRAIIHKATQGTQHVDTQYAVRQRQARAFDMLWGAYHFGTGDDPIQQADHFLKTAAADDRTLLVLDFEANPTQGQADMNLVTAERFVQHVQESTGRWPMLYTGLWYLNQHLAPGQTTILAECPLWLASYTSTPPTPPSQWSQWTLWQYTNGVTGPEPRDVQGVRRVDRDLFNGTMDELKRFWGA